MKASSFFTLLLFLLCLSFQGCEIEFENPNASTVDEILATVDGQIALAVGITQEFSGAALRHIIQAPAITTREVAITNTFVNLIELEEGAGAVTGMNANVSGMWSSLYKVINMAVSIDPEKAEALSVSSKKVLSAHASLFQGISYGTLAQNYAGAPDVSDGASGVFLGTAELYSLALTKLKEARTTIAGVDLTKDKAAKALYPRAFSLPDVIEAYIARYSLFSGDYAQALAAAGNVDAGSSSWFYYDTQTRNPIWVQVFSGSKANFKPRDGFGLPESFSVSAAKEVQTATVTDKDTTGSPFTIQVTATPSDGGTNLVKEFMITVAAPPEEPDTPVTPDPAVVLSGTTIETGAADRKVGDLTISNPAQDVGYTYSLTNDAAGKFKIVGTASSSQNSIQVHTAEAISATTGSPFTIEVTAAPSGDGTDLVKEFMITVTDADNPPDPMVVLSGTSIEFGAADRRVGGLTVSNPAQGVTYAFSITNDADGKFKIVGSFSDGRTAFYLKGLGEVNEKSKFPIEDLKGFFTAATDSIPIYLPAEMKLIEAEAKARTDDLAGALAAINAVRTRTTDLAGIIPGLSAFIPASATDNEELLTEIYFNRRAELFLTGVSLVDHRRFERKAPSGIIENKEDERNLNFYPYPEQERRNSDLGKDFPSNPTL